MDWARDNTGVSEKDLDNVFKYEEKPATVVRMLVGSKEPEIWSLQGEKEWDDWIHNDRPHIDGSASGLVLILAKRTGELAFGGVKKIRSNAWLDLINEEMPGRSNTERTFESLTEKGEAGGPGSGIGSGRRNVRTLPFSKNTFRLITSKFYTHRSIARDISRADIPVFSSAEVRMGERAYPSYVYNCRSSHAWDMDLALTATYFPHCGLTYAILFGCPLSVEEEIVKRLSFATAEIAHPLLMPGIFAEIEMSRHVHIVEATIDELETKILELDFTSNWESIPLSETEKRNQEKRTAWLNTTYLRNALVSWNAQLAKMSDHTDELKSTVFKLKEPQETDRKTRDRFEDNSSNISTSEPQPNQAISSTQSELSDASSEKGLEEEWPSPHGDHLQSGKEYQKCLRRCKNPVIQRNPEVIKEQMQRVGNKIKNRIQAIISEYDNKIRDCTMRVDGMAMATQWSHSEANVEIALATGRESKHMRSIAIVTMVFLPGTFLASVFSMTFFNWNQESAVISSYIWIYITLAFFFTVLTIGSWWYFVVYRPSRSRKLTEEEIPLV
ncbi:hypothetical protein F5884DRAFT_802481 [Xylogone sp. PMI_703]|nr:hypothetical protein F5884DRAFT_802481 [Xylogone sp. PMI_703]